MKKSGNVYCCQGYGGKVLHHMAGEDMNEILKSLETTS